MTTGLRTVGINALFLDPGRSGGPETYMRELVGALVEEAPRTRFTLVTTRRGAAALARDGWRDRVELVALPADEGQRGRRQLAEQLLLPRLARRRRFDVLHSLASVAPIVAGVPSAITLHDVTFFRHRTFGLLTTYGMRVIVSQAARRADALLTGSVAARDEICEVLGFAPERFDVVPHGLGRVHAVPAEEHAAVRARHGLDGDRLVLCVAAKRPHKNQEVLVRAAPLLGERTDVVLAGHPEAYDAELRRIASDVGARRVRFADYVPDAELEALWQLADCAVFPTRAEGFGLPVVEAMDRGVPVACSDIPVLREVGGDVPRYFDPDDPAGAAAAVEGAIAERDERAARGRERAARYSWAEAARGTLAAYERARHAAVARVP
ncbi:MAG TPA: glycosyltransferase family 1 protein [Conexibacter sp.]|nr:glycosyltransferase family 1 protein [Conexibacter sp.]